MRKYTPVGTFDVWLHHSIYIYIYNIIYIHMRACVHIYTHKTIHGIYTSTCMLMMHVVYVRNTHSCMYGIASNFYDSTSSGGARNMYLY